MRNAILRVLARREEIVEELLAIRSLERGALSEQYVARPGESGEPAGRLGPYYVLSHWREGRNQSRRVPRPEVNRVRRDLANYERFAQLCRELEELTCRLGQLEREEGAASDEAGKNGLKSRRRSGK